MPGRCAVWLDHSKASIVTFTSDGEATIETIESGIEGVHKTTGGARAKAPYLHGAVSKSSEEERRHHQLVRFYDHIIDKIIESRRILIMGPGLAKQELYKRIEALPGQTKPKLELHAAEKMTKRQLIARVRKELGIEQPL
jgi:stalled ribosome rescue protein Dom34